MHESKSSGVPIGLEVVFRKTIAESDVYLYAGITGDMSPNHIDEEFMRKSRFGRRIVHGTLMIGLMSGAASRAIIGNTVSRGYDSIRFTAPVFIGDTIEVRYRVAEHDPARNRIASEVTCTNQDGVVVARGVHLRALFEAASA